MNKSKRGITLIALVITIIVLLILAAISLTMLTGENSILKRAVDAKEKTEIEQYREQIEVEVLGSFEKNGDLVATKIKDNIENHITGASVDGEDFDLDVTIGEYKFKIKNDGQVIEDGKITDTPKAKATLKSSISEALGTINQEEFIAMNQEFILNISEEQKTYLAMLMERGDLNAAGVTKIEKFNGTSEQAQEKGVIVSTDDSEKPVYMWFEQDEGKKEKFNILIYDININSGKLYWYSEADEIYFNSDCKNMFYQFQNLEDLNSIKAWKTDNVTNMNSMFEGCMKLTNINAMKDWNTSNVVNMSRMFCDCGSLNDVSGLKNWDVKKVEDMSDLFGLSLDTNISKVPIIDGTVFSKWNTSSLKNSNNMFERCSELISLNLSNFDTKNIEYSYNMFVECNKLQKIIVGPNWDGTKFDNNSDFDNMFYGCTALVGGAGTTYSENEFDGKYAHIDEGPSNPGYLTSR